MPNLKKKDLIWRILCRLFKNDLLEATGCYKKYKIMENNVHKIDESGCYKLTEAIMITTMFTMKSGYTLNTSI